MTDGDHDPASRQEFANPPRRGRRLGLSASQVFPPIFAAAAFIAIGLFVTHFTDVWVGPWVMWLTLFAPLGLLHLPLCAREPNKRLRRFA
jgi:hypothetical protein